MKILVTYFSTEGMTEKLAKALASNIEADISYGRKVCDEDIYYTSWRNKEK